MKHILVSLFMFFAFAGVNAQLLSKPLRVGLTSPVELDYAVKGSLIKKLIVAVNLEGDYANLSLYANEQLLVDNVDVPSAGDHILNLLVKFRANEAIKLKLVAMNNDLVIKDIKLEDVTDIEYPIFKDISEKAGLDRVNSIKYGGPCVADLDQDGDYDFIVINHNAETNKLYWNNGDGTVTKHNQNLSRWFMQDLHGASCADYDGDGDLDIMQTKGGGNGKAPSLPDFYRNDNGKLTLVTLDAGITVGARGRGAKWSDMDKDGDLDLMLVNAKGINGETPQHNFYRNNGDGTFDTIRVAGIENADAQRALITDLNNDNIDDLVMYDPTNTIWLGNGDFTFTNITDRLPEGFMDINRMMGVTDIDIDNDGDLDLYYARGNAFGVGVKPSFDFCPVHMRMDIKIRNKGSFELALESEKDIDLHDYDFTGRNGFKGEEFPIYLGQKKVTSFLNKGGRMLISQADANGWPKDISGNGIYFGHIGDGNWRSAVVINGDIFWNVGFSLIGIKNATPEFIRLNKNPKDVLLRNDGGTFVDVSDEWNIPTGGNHSGVAVGDFNNDGWNDLFIHRYGQIRSKDSDLMLINNGKGSFETITAHGANDMEDKGNGDMGQVFDFDLDGDVDMLNGSEENGMWYLYENQYSAHNNYALVKVGYAPESKMDAISATVVLETPSKIYRKRVGSSGEIFSQSLLNIVHFGLGEDEEIKKITVEWRNGEKVIITDKKANRVFDTDNVDPTSITFIDAESEVRKGTKIQLSAQILPINANQELVWTSSDENVLKVDQNGIVTAVGKAGKSAIVTAKSKLNEVVANVKLKVVKNYKIDVNKIDLSAEKNMVYTNHQLQLIATVLPKYADNQSVVWSSSDAAIATVNESGVVTGMAAGNVVITAVSQDNKTIVGSFNLNVQAYVEPGIFIQDSIKFTTQEFAIGDTMEVVVNYSAGSGNVVAAQDLGGVKIWFRQMNNRWMASGNYDCIVDADALGKESGVTKAYVTIDELTPSAELPEGYLYYLYVGMASSNGNIYTKEFYPIKIVAKKK